MSNKTQLIVQVYSYTGFQTYFPSVLCFALNAFILPFVGVEAEATVNEYINLVKVEERVACIGSYFESIALGTVVVLVFVTNHRTDSPLVIENITYFR